jgi:hypothetical protein
MAKKKEVPVGYFPETIQKDVLRARDMELIRKLAASKGRSLFYCGLTGSEAADVLKWREWLSRVLAVQVHIPDEVKRVRFEADLMLKLAPHFNGNIKIVYDDVWEYLASEKFAKLSAVPDVVNLDFCGGFLYEVDMNYPKQRAAFQKLFESASKAGEDFILLLTLMPRDKGKETYKKYLEGLISSLANNTPRGNKAKLHASLDANLRFHRRANLRLFKACLPILISDIGRSHNFIVRASYIRLYTKLIHMAFECTFVRNVLGLAADPRAVIALLNQPMRKLLETGGEEQEWPPQIIPE